MSKYESLTALDAGFLYAEKSTMLSNMGNVCILEGEKLFDDRGVFRIDDVRRAIESRLRLVPRYRTRLIEVPYADDGDGADGANGTAHG